jgi:ribosome biogenesis GTPase
MQHRKPISFQKTALGQHTTTSTRLIKFGSNGALIDSPGIREFGLWHLNLEKVRTGFPEIESHLGLCQFRNCTHTHEKNCALKQAVDQVKFYASFRQLFTPH